MFFGVKSTEKCNGNNIICIKQFLNSKKKDFSEMSFFRKMDFYGSCQKCTFLQLKVKVHI